MNNNPIATVFAVILCVLFVVFLIGGGCYIQPRYNVWEQEKQGEAEYARAESSRKIAILEAEAKLQAAKSLAQAEVERARGVAEANKIIGDGLKGHDEYLRYLWIMSLEHAAINGKSTTVYIPTEANLPILEASHEK